MSRPGRPPRKEFLVFGAPLIEEPEVAEVLATLKSGWLGTGPRVHAFERQFASYEGVPDAAALNSCTAALHLSLLALDLKPGDEVVTTPMTFCATVNTILHAGATPVLADVDPRTQNIDPSAVADAVTSRTKAILPVHFAGRACDMDGIMKVAGAEGLAVVEDCAHAIETTYKGRKAGTFGDFGCFSFYATKNVATGEGGMAIAKDPDRLARLRILGLHGMSRDAWKRFTSSGYKHYQVVEYGFKYNMMDLQAAIGIHQLARVEQNWGKRERLWHLYDRHLEGSGLELPAPPEADTKHAYHLYTVMVDEAKVGVSRDAFLESMAQKKIGVGVHYQSVPEHPVYQERLGWDPKGWPEAQRLGQQTVSLPLSPKMTEDDVLDVVAAVDATLRR
ncbi:MAG TPA: DegT/DnrJ/EryC1/StrS family aminotransferase [Candidatus Thermoplasmatota archaeon]|nr:DegT/DnrJ/EryC1/StrS family aminotransferase [Candidatus Thermoplasmatota archaeon]